jgi:protein-arginine kinase activator protein McsA
MSGSEQSAKPALCEDCKQAKPKSKITREKNGTTYTLWLCKACAEERQQCDHTKSLSHTH